MFSSQQKIAIIQMALTYFRLQKDRHLSVDDFELFIGHPSHGSLCSLLILSKPGVSTIKLKLHFIGLYKYSWIRNYGLMQEQNYPTGAGDEFQVADCYLDEHLFRNFHRYVLSPKFISEVTSERFIAQEETDDLITFENDTLILLEN